MGRAPCCDKNGLKKGPWTPEEDQKLIDYIQKNGHGNWRTLPSNAGILVFHYICFLLLLNYVFFYVLTLGFYVFFRTFRTPKMWEELSFKMD